MALNIIDRYGLSSVGEPGAITLASGYTSGGTSLSVSSATGLPSGACDFYLIVEAFAGTSPDGSNTEEVFHVTNVSGTTLTVAGAQAGTSASNHGSGANVLASIWTAAAFSDFISGISGAIVPNPNAGAPSINGVPNTGWSVANSAILDDFLLPTVWVENSASGTQWRIASKNITDFIASSTPPYTIIFQVESVQTSIGSNSSDGGFYLYDGTKLEGMELLQQGSGGSDQLRIEKLNSVTSDGGTVAGPTQYVVPYRFTGKIVDDNTHRKWYYWASGAWNLMLTETTGTFLTPTKVAFGGVMIVNGNEYSQTTLNYLSITSP